MCYLFPFACEVDDVVAVVHELKEMGVHVEHKPFRKGPEVIAILRDPDGYLIELNEDTTHSKKNQARN